MENLICKCGRQCKNKSGLTNHLKKCYLYNKYERICSGCGKKILYKNKYNYERAEKRNSRCNIYCNRNVWNKNLTKEIDERISKYSKKISDIKKGTIPWNKGKKGVQIAWNKGLTKNDDKRIIGPWKNKKIPKHTIKAMVEGRKKYYEKYPDAKKRGIKSVKNISKPQIFLYEKLKGIFNNVKLDFYLKVNDKQYYFIDILVNDKIAIEVDGKFWHSGENKKLYDQKRDLEINKIYKIIRYDAQYVFKNVDIIINNIKNII